MRFIIGIAVGVGAAFAGGKFFESELGKLFIPGPDDIRKAATISHVIAGVGAGVGTALLIMLIKKR